MTSDLATSRDHSEPSAIAVNPAAADCHWIINRRHRHEIFGFCRSAQRGIDSFISAPKNEQESNNGGGLHPVVSDQQRQ